MKKDIKERWVTALRSGRYEQGKGALRDYQGKFCCLGVLCDLAAQERIVDVEDEVDGVVPYGGRTGVLPPQVLTWAGMTDPNPDVYFGGERFALSALNDGRRLTFEQIADLIEAQPEGSIGQRS